MLTKFHFLRVILIITLALCFIKGAFAQQKQTANCGVVSVLSLVHSLGKDIGSQNELSILQKYPQSEVSIGDVKQMSEIAGINTIAVKATLQDLAELRQPSIIHLSKPDHFSLLEAQTADGVRLIENASYVFMKKDEFERRFDGYALILVNSPVSRKSEASFEALDYQKGIVSLRANISSVFKVTNTGQEPLVITPSFVSCGCTTVTFDGENTRSALVVQPGKSSDIQMLYNAATFGEQLQYIQLKTNDPDRPAVTLSLRAYVPQDTKVSVSSLRLNTKKGFAVEKSFTATTKPTTSIKQIVSSEAHLKVDYRVVQETPDFKKWSFVVRQDAQMPVGESKASLSIHTTDESGASISIPVQTVVDGDIRVEPKQAFLGFLGIGESKSIPIKLSSDDDKPFKVLSWKLQKEQAKADQEIFVDEVTTDGSNKAFQLRVTGKQEHLIDNSLVIETDVLGEETLTIPISGMVDKAASRNASIATEETLIQKANNLPRAEDGMNFKAGKPIPQVKVGETAPDFTVLDSEGKPWKLSALRGKKSVLLTFFPQCFTRGCATQLVSLCAQLPAIEATGTQVIAVSVDATEGPHGQRAFAKEWDIPFPLIPDTQRQLCLLYGAVQSSDQRAARMTIFIDKSGIVRFIDTNVDVKNHGTDVLEVIKKNS